MEAAGIPTVIIAAAVFRGRLAGMKPPRVLLTPHLMGRPLGPPHDRKRQRNTVRAALNLLAEAQAGGQLVTFSEED
jgi:hypothetical protein